MQTTKNLPTSSKSILRDDAGIAYGIFVVCIFIFMAGVYYIFNGSIVNRFIVVFNGFISQGMVGQQTADNFTFIKDAWIALPLFMLIGVTLWGWIRALEKKNMEG